MKVQRRKAKPWDGDLTKLPHEVRAWMATHPGFRPGVSKAVYPVCEAVRWGGHSHTPSDPREAALHARVERIPFSDEAHPRVQLALRWGKDPTVCGYCKNRLGHDRIVEIGDHIVEWPDGLVHHGNQDGKDITPWYETDQAKFETPA